MKVKELMVILAGFNPEKTVRVNGFSTIEVYYDATVGSLSPIPEIRDNAGAVEIKGYHIG